MLERNLFLKHPFWLRCRSYITTALTNVVWSSRDVTTRQQNLAWTRRAIANWNETHFTDVRNAPTVWCVKDHSAKQYVLISRTFLRSEVGNPRGCSESVGRASLAPRGAIAFSRVAPRISTQSLPRVWSGNLICSRELLISTVYEEEEMSKEFQELAALSAWVPLMTNRKWMQGFANLVLKISVN